ncbi:MAG: hypothetical protein ACR2JB_09675 [Bryobacteraceae bacterium]
MPSKSSPWIGKWKMASVAPDGSEVLLDLTYEDGQYTTPLVPMFSKDFKVDGQKDSLRIPYQGEDYDIDLEPRGSKLVDTWSGKRL